MEWRPFPFQERILQRSEYEVLAGGARGPGKTEAGIIWLLEYYQESLAKALVVRENAKDLADWIDRAMKIYSFLGATYAQQQSVIRFPSGYFIRIGHLADDQAYTNYMGQEYHRMLIEELTQILSEKRYLQLTASCRSSHPHLKPQILATTNPGGVGHGWVKARFVDPAPWGTPFRDPESHRWRVFIPGKIEDNPKLMQSDPDYVRTLDALKGTDVELYRAWRLGEWDVFAGQFFREFSRTKHVVQARTPSPKLEKHGGVDWGRTAPFCFLAGAVTNVKLESGVVFHRCFIYQEIYGTDQTPKDWAEVIKHRVDVDSFDEIRADPAMFTKGQDSSISIADQFKEENIWMRPASNDRIGGWSVLHDWLSMAPDGAPYLLIGDNCVNLIRTLPMLQHDTAKGKIEDVDTTQEDHAADALRYLLKHVKWIDAKVGGVSYTRPVLRAKQTATIVNDRQIPIDPGKFR